VDERAVGAAAACGWGVGWAGFAEERKAPPLITHNAAVAMTRTPMIDQNVFIAKC
jgi:hypothetical protein